MLESLLTLDSIYKRFTKAAYELEETIEVPLCISNCGKCCEITLARRIEIVYALSTLKNTDKYNEVISRAEKWLLKKHHGLKMYGKASNSSNKLVKEFERVMRFPCPFLNDDKSCLLYEGRPLVCRAYGVTRVSGPTALSCPRPLGKNETKFCHAFIDASDLKTYVNNWISKLTPEDNFTGFLPAMLYKEAHPDKYTNILPLVASAKTVETQIYEGMLWQEQLKQVWAKR